MKLELLSVLRRIRECENEATAMLLLESYVKQMVEAEREECASLCILADSIGRRVGGRECANAINQRGKQ